jgi:hypothetical protein
MIVMGCHRVGLLDGVMLRILASTTQALLFHARGGKGVGGGGQESG